MSQTEIREHKVMCDYGTPDYFKYYSKNAKDPISRKVFSKVFRDYLDANRRAIYQFGYIFVLPQRMGRIEIRKRKAEVSIGKDGEIINKLAINWAETKRIWEINPEAKEKKVLIRHTNEHTDGYVFRVRYMKNTANYKNKSIYKMQINRGLSRGTAPAILSGRLDAFLLKPEKYV